MKRRIMAAWKVLRGEWVAKPPEPTFTVYWNGAPCRGYYATNVPTSNSGRHAP